MKNLVDYKKLYGVNRKNKILEALLERQRGTVEQRQGTIAQLQEQVADLQRRDIPRWSQHTLVKEHHDKAAG